MTAEVVDVVEEVHEAPKGVIAQPTTPDGLDSVISGVDEPTTSDEEATPEQVELPDKYRGKTAKELVEMHQNAEALLGRQSAEVGELRGVVDNFIQSQITATETQTTDEEEPDFHLDPEAATAHAISNHPDVLEAKRSGQELKKQSSLAALKAKHPDMQEVLGNPKFHEWVQASPTRLRLFREADADYNFESADELLGSFKERVAVVASAVEQESRTRAEAINSASTGGAHASSAVPSKKVYRRTDIIKLMKTDPQRYQALQPEIMEAYANNRVK